MKPPQASAKIDTAVRIVEAAVQIFSRQGFSGTSTREIAQLAKVNEVTIYRLFTRKKDLFWAAVDSRLARLRVNRALEVALAGGGENPEFVVGLIFEFLVDAVVRHPDLIRLLGFSALELGPGAELMTRKHLSPIFCSVAAYLERCTERGTLFTVDPVITVLGFAGTVVANHCAFEAVTGLEVQFENPDKAIAQYTKYWLQALSPKRERIGKTPARELAGVLTISDNN